MSTRRNILITGGAGFIGSHVVRLFVSKYPDYRIVNLDKLTYAGNLSNLKDIENASNYWFVKADICDFDKIREVLVQYAINGIIHLAAESHVDRSICDPFTFRMYERPRHVVATVGGKILLGVFVEGKHFYHIVINEVYGTLELTSCRTRFALCNRFNKIVERSYALRHRDSAVIVASSKSASRLARKMGCIAISFAKVSATPANLPDYWLTASKHFYINFLTN